MALGKEITMSNGIVTNYHKLKGVDFNFVENQTVISVDNYVSKEVRDKANEITEINESISQLVTQIEKAEKTGNTELIESLSDKLHTLYHQQVELSNRHFEADSENILLEGVPDEISFAGIYKLLKTTPKYSKAKKV